MLGLASTATLSRLCPAPLAGRRWFRGVSAWAAAAVDCPRAGLHCSAACCGLLLFSCAATRPQPEESPLALWQRAVAGDHLSSCSCSCSLQLHSASTRCCSAPTRRHSPTLWEWRRLPVWCERSSAPSVLHTALGSAVRLPVHSVSCTTPAPCIIACEGTFLRMEEQHTAQHDVSDRTRTRYALAHASELLALSASAAWSSRQLITAGDVVTAVRRVDRHSHVALLPP